MAASWLFVDGAPQFGGHETMLLRLLEELAAAGWVQPCLLARADTRLRTAGAGFATAEALPPAPAEGLIARLTRIARDAVVFVRAARRLRPACCVVAEGCLLAQAPFVVLARFLGLPVAVYVPLTESFRSMGFRRAWLKDGLVRALYANLPDAWIVITEDQAQAFRDWAGVRRPILTLPNTVAPAIEGRAKEPLPAPSGDVLRVLVLGRLDRHQKGLDLLLDFLEREPPAPDIRLSLVGDGGYAGEIRRRLNANPALKARVLLESWADPVEVLSRHDVLLLPSRFEGVPLVMLEAMALGLPVAASDLPGTRGHLSTDSLFPVGDLGRAFAILRRLADPAERAREAAANRRAFEERASGKAFRRAVAELAERMNGRAAEPQAFAEKTSPP